MLNRLDSEFRFHQGALALRAERQQVLASNIANADTPNFKARDMDFRKVLTQALGANGTTAAGIHGALPDAATSGPAGGASTSLAASHRSHWQVVSRAGGTASGSELLYRQPRQDSLDGNTVELDAERAQFADNALRYEASVSAVNGKIKGLLTAITGQ